MWCGYVQQAFGIVYSDVTVVGGGPHRWTPSAGAAAANGGVVVPGSMLDAKWVPGSYAQYDTYGNAGTTRGALARISDAGALMWQQSYGASAEDGKLYAAALRSSGGVIAAGRVIASDGQQRLWLLAVAANGGELWSRRRPEDTGVIEVGAIIPSTDDDFLLGGTALVAGKKQPWIARRSRDGLPLWQHGYGQLGVAVTAASPLLRFVDDRLAFVGFGGVAGEPSPVVVRASPWGQAPCDVAGVCAGKQEAACVDGKPCTIDACDAKSGCNHAAPTPCSPLAPCTVAGCGVTGCGYAPDPCDDGDLCTVDSCDPAKVGKSGSGCSHSAVDCDDGNVCTVDSCAKATGCANVAAKDGVACAVDSCRAGVCGAGQCDAKVNPTKLGCTTAKAAPSCKALLADDPALIDDVYWLDPDGSGGPAAPYQARCDMTHQGGGWTLLMKHDGGCTFHRDSLVWTTTDTWDPLELSLQPGNAKYPSFNNLVVKELRAEWHDDDVEHVQPLPGPMTLLAGTAGPPLAMTPAPNWRGPNWPQPTFPATYYADYGFNRGLYGKWPPRWGALYHWGSVSWGAVGVGFTCVGGASAGNAHWDGKQAGVIWGVWKRPLRIWGR